MAPEHWNFQSFNFSYLCFWVESFKEFAFCFERVKSYGNLFPVFKQQVKSSAGWRGKSIKGEGEVIRTKECSISLRPTRRNDRVSPSLSPSLPLPISEAKWGHHFHKQILVFVFTKNWNHRNIQWDLHKGVIESFGDFYLLSRPSGGIGRLYLPFKQ